jgi:hypothetical protein
MINMNYKRVTIDIDEADTAVSNWAEDNTNTFTDGVWGVDEAGVYHMFHHSRNDIVKFEEVHNPCPNCLHGWRRDVGPDASDEECFTCNTTGFVPQ